MLDYGEQVSFVIDPETRESRLLAESSPKRAGSCIFLGRAPLADLYWDGKGFTPDWHAAVQITQDTRADPYEACKALCAEVCRRGFYVIPYWFPKDRHP